MAGQKDEFFLRKLVNTEREGTYYSANVFLH